MIRMLVKFTGSNEDAVQNLMAQVAQLFNKRHIEDKESDCIWLGNGDEKDFERFSRTNTDFLKIEGFGELLESWIWDINGEVEDLREFHYKESSAESDLYFMESTAVEEENSRIQITFAPDVKKLDELGANWYNIVLDISEFLKNEGFEYSRTLGYINDRVLDEEELARITNEIISIGLGPEYFLYLNARVISNVQDMTWMFRDEEDE